MREEILGVGRAAKPYFTDLTSWFQTENFGPFLAALLLALGLLVLVLLIVRTLYVGLRIRTARRIVSGAKTPESFVERFGAIDGALRGNRVVAGAWRGFAAGLTHPEQTETAIASSMALRTPTRPQAFFTAEETGLTLPYFRMGANLFVGIGLLLTFAGLVSALELAVGGFGDAGTDATRIQSSLRGLLVTSAAKFYSSLAALAVSLILTISVRVSQTALGRALRKLAATIDELVVPVTAEALMARQIGELEEHTRQLKTFNTDLAMKIGERIEIAVSGALKGVGEKLDKVASSLGQDNITAIQQIGKSVSDSMQGAAGASLDRLAERMDGVGTALSTLVGSLGQSGQSFQQDIAAAMATLRTDLAGLTSTLSGVSDGMRTSLQDGAANITASLEAAIRDLTAATARSALQMEEAVKRLSAGVQEAATAAAQTAGTVVEKAGADAGAQLNSAANGVAESLSGSFKPLLGAAETLAGSFSGLQSAADRLGIGMTEAVKGATSAGTRLEQAGQQVASASQALRQTVEPALAATQRIEQAATAMREASQAAGAAAAQIATDLQATRALWERHSGRFDAVDAKLGEAFAQITQGLTDNVDKLSIFVRVTDTAFSGAIGALAEAIDELRESRPSRTLVQ